MYISYRLPDLLHSLSSISSVELIVFISSLCRQSVIGKTMYLLPATIVFIVTASTTASYNGRRLSSSVEIRRNCVSILQSEPLWLTPSLASIYIRRDVDKQPRIFVTTFLKSKSNFYGEEYDDDEYKNDNNNNNNHRDTIETYDVKNQYGAKLTDCASFDEMFLPADPNVARFLANGTRTRSVKTKTRIVDVDTFSCLSISKVCTALIYFYIYLDDRDSICRFYANDDIPPPDYMPLEGGDLCYHFIIGSARSSNRRHHESSLSFLLN